MILIHIRFTDNSLLFISYNLGASWVIAIRELSSITNSVTFEVIESQPESQIASVIHTISLKKVSDGGTLRVSTFVEWVSDFSSDATADVITDSSFKRREAFGDLEKASA